MPSQLYRPGTAEGRAGWAALRQSPRNAVIALDYDGTLAPIVDRPEDAEPAPGAREVLLSLAAQVGRLALVTGRPARDVVQSAGLTGVPGLVVLGQYGAQRWDGELHSAPPAPGLAAVRAELPALLGAGGHASQPAPRIEDKGLSLVVHVRGLPQPENALRAIAPGIRALAARHGLQVHPGRLVLEIRPPGHDKRAALLSLCTGAPSAVLFAGDDVGDLPAYDAVDLLRTRGIPGVLVCSASREGPRELRDRADLVVHGPAGVVRLLQRLLA